MSKEPYEPDYYHGNYPAKPKISEPWKIHPHAGKDLQFEKPKSITIADLFPNLGRQTIGWSPLLETLREVTASKPSYPPYDIVAVEDGVNLLNVAVAGFSKKELSVTVQDSVLTIEGKKKNKQQGNLVYQGIAARDFSLRLAIAEYWEVTNSRLEDGMLTVQFNKNLPDEKKPKVIDIS